MGIDHRGFHVLVPQQFLNRPDIVTAFQQMRGEGMAERVASGAFGQPGLVATAPRGERLSGRSIRPHDSFPPRHLPFRT